MIVANPHGPQNLRYKLSFAEASQRFEIADEQIENESRGDKPSHYYFNNGQPTLYGTKQEGVERDKSILAQRRDPVQYPEVTYLAQIFSKIRLYREWGFGRYTAPRLPQKADLPNDALEPDG